MGLQAVAHGPAATMRREKASSTTASEHRRNPAQVGMSGNISDPELVWRVGVEDHLRSTRSHAGRTLSVPEGRAGGFTATNTGNTGRFHQALDPLAAHLDAFIDKFSVDTRRSIGCSGVRMDRLDPVRQSRVQRRDGSGRRRSVAPSIVAGSLIRRGFCSWSWLGTWPGLPSSIRRPRRHRVALSKPGRGLCQDISLLA